MTNKTNLLSEDLNLRNWEKTIEKLTTGNRTPAVKKEPKVSGRVSSGAPEPTQDTQEQPPVAKKTKITPTGVTGDQKPEEETPEDEMVTQTDPPVPDLLGRPDWLPSFEEVDPAFREIQLFEGTGTGFAITGASDEPGEPGSGGGGISADASGQFVVPDEISALAQLMKKAGYPEPCYKFLTSREGMETIFAPFLFVGAGGVATAAIAGFKAGGWMAMWASLQSIIRGAAKRVLGKVEKPWAKIAMMSLKVAGVATITQGAMMLTRQSESIYSLFRNLLVTSGLLPDEDKVGADCVIIAEMILIALCYVAITLVSKELFTRALLKSGGGAASIAKSFAKLGQLFATKLIKIIRSRGQETKEMVEQSVETVIAKNRDVLDELGDETLATIESIPKLVGEMGVTSRQITTYVYATIDPSNPKQKQLADRLLGEVFSKIDNDYKILRAKRSEQALRKAKEAGSQYDEVVKELRGQAGFDFGDVLDGNSYTTTEKLMRKAFDANDIDEAASLLDDIAKTARERGFIKGPLFDKKALIEFAADAKNQATKAGNPITSLEILNFVMNRVSSDAKKLRIDLEDFGKFTTQTSQEVSEKITGQELSKIIKDRVDKTVKRLSKDLDGLDNVNAPDQISQIKQSAEKVSEEAFEQLEQQASEKGLTLTKKAAISIVSVATLGTLTAAYRALDKPEPSRAPWFFKDDSVFSSLNSLNEFMGREQYSKLEKEVLKSNKAKKEFLNIVFDTKNPKTNQFIDKLASLSADQIPEDELISFSKEKLKEFSELHKDEILSSLEKKVKIEELYGTDDLGAISQKKEVMFRLISEMFLFNENFNGKLVNFLVKVERLKKNYTKQNRILDLKEIFGTGAKRMSLGSYKSKLPKVMSQNNPIFDQADQSPTNDNDNKQANKEKVSPQAAAAKINEFFNKSMKEMIKIPLADRKDAVRKYLQASGASQKAGLPIEVFVALIGKESKFINKGLRGDKKLKNGPSYGLGQILRITAEEIVKKTGKELEDHLDIASNNLDASVKYHARITNFLQELKVWGKASDEEKLQLKLYAYNRGMGRVKKTAEKAFDEPKETLDLLAEVYKPKRPYALDILDRAGYSSVTVNPKESIVYNLDNLKGLVSEVITEQQESELPSLQDKLAANLEPRIATADPGMGEYYNKVLKFAQTKLPFGDNVYRVEYGAIQNTTENAPALLDEETADSFYNLLLDWLNTGLKPLKLHGKTPSYDSVLDASDRNETSQHKHGMALDINIPFGSNDPMHLKYKQKLLELALNNGFRGFGFGPTVMHIDTRQEYGWWIYGGEKWDFAGAIGRVVPLRSDAFRELGLAAGGWPTSKVKQTFLAMTDVRNKKGVREMSKKDIRQLVAEVLNESYSKYDYNSNEYTEDEPNEDYQVEWSAMVDEVCDARRKNIDGDPRTFEDTAIEVAKILVKDSDLFRDVLEMAGSNKSIGVEIMQQLKAAKEKKTLDKKENV